MKDYIKVAVAVFILGFVGILYPLLEETGIPLNGVVCNFSSDSLWLTVTDTEMMQFYSLHRGGCTNPFVQDVEAIWGKDCSSDPCQYQAWKLGVGLFEVNDTAGSPSSLTIHIRGWGAGSGWHINWDWPKPELSTIHYSLVR